jgi:hypothetical protein
VNSKPSYTSLNQDFITFLKEWQKSYERRGRANYEGDNFQWERPEKEISFDKLEDLAQPFEHASIDKDLKEFVEKLKESGGTRSDFMIYSAPYDLMLAYGRAFYSRHVSKLAHFAHSAGVAERAGGEHGIINEGVHKYYKDILKNAQGNAQNVPKDA